MEGNTNVPKNPTSPIETPLLKLDPYENTKYTEEQHAAATTIQRSIRDSPHFSSNYPDKSKYTESSVGMKPSYSTTSVRSSNGDNSKSKRKKNKSKSCNFKKIL